MPFATLPSCITTLSLSIPAFISPVITEFFTIIVSSPLFPVIASCNDEPSLFVIVFPLIVEFVTVILSFPASPEMYSVIVELLTVILSAPEPPYTDFTVTPFKTNVSSPSLPNIFKFARVEAGSFKVVKGVI